MKQVVIRDGKVEVVEMPAPRPQRGQVLVETLYSCISAGTEAATVSNSLNGLTHTIAHHPGRIKRAAEILQDDGLGQLITTVRNRNQAYTVSGYSCAGRIIDKDPELTQFDIGDLVSCAGAQHAHHAEIVAVPEKLTAIVPAQVDPCSAATATIGAIALQGVRRASLNLGEVALVIGLGLVGQITATLLKASGVNVIAIDIDPNRVAIAGEGGAAHALTGPITDHLANINRLTHGMGVDAVIITAATKSNDVLNDAMRTCRMKGKVVVVGDVGMNVDRSIMYARELDLLISTSYGPGRYDPQYEERGIDYPYGYVRWTENRNMQAYLDMLANGSISLQHLTQQTYTIDDAADAYETLSGDKPPLIVTLQYSTTEIQTKARTLTPVKFDKAVRDKITTALIGPGQFAQGKTLPILRKLPGVRLQYVAGRSGSTATQVAQRFGAAFATTDTEELLSDPELDCVIITTRHQDHGQQVLQALRAGKHVFVEKPLAIEPAELAEISTFFEEQSDPPVLMTGFNRRFAPILADLRQDLTRRTSPLYITYNMNVGFIEPSDWTLGSEGGGRNLGEACHIYDLIQFLTGSEVIDITARRIRASTLYPADGNFIATLTHKDGSLSSLAYNMLGHEKMPKERMELHYDNKSFVMDDYKSTMTFGSGIEPTKSKQQDKGHSAALTAFFKTIANGGEWPISLSEQLETCRIAFNIQQQLTQQPSLSA